MNLASSYSFLLGIYLLWLQSNLDVPSIRKIYRLILPLKRKSYLAIGHHESQLRRL